MEFYKAFNLFWELGTTMEGTEFVRDTPFCSNDSCRVPLDQANFGEDNTGRYIRGWQCSNCEKKYPCPNNDYIGLIALVQKKFEGYRRKNYQVYSLDLSPTKVVDEAEDENYWVQARISEKNGKRMAVIYFGEKVKGKQDKKDYSQVFVDFEDEQVRFDKNNKNPMKLLSKLTAEFDGSETVLKKK